MTRVLVFGSFDPLHVGHKDFFRQARSLGDELWAVVARDAAIRQQKGREPAVSEAERLAAVQAVPDVFRALLGDEEPGRYGLLQELPFDVLALGYDQRPDDDQVQALLQDMGKNQVRVVRLTPFEPEQFKSSYFRD